MKYYIEGVYYREAAHCRLEQEWYRTKPQISFKEWLTEQSGSDQVSGNWEDGWTVKFLDEEKYTWFLLKWSGESYR